MRSHQTQVASCRVCGGTVPLGVDFGDQPVSQAFESPTATTPLPRFRLAVGVCTGCGMAQQFEELPPEQMFHADYAYRSSESMRVREHFTGIAERLLRDEATGPDPFLVEIGSNDGVLLRRVRDEGVRHLGVDPSARAASLAADEGISTLVDFFDRRSAAAVRRDHGPADVVFSANTTSHVSDVVAVFEGVRDLLAPDGVFVVEDRYVADIIDNRSFDQIYDEHFYLFGVSSVRELARRTGLELVDVQRLAIHGGSIRYTIALAGARPPSPAVAALVADEAARGVVDPDCFAAFGTHLRDTCHGLVELLRELRRDGRSVAGYGATAKSATVMNYCGLDTSLIPFVCDSTSVKHGLLTPGTRIPIVPTEQFRDPYPDYAVLFAWNHAEEILHKEREFAERGGRWILYVPELHVL